MKKDIHPKYHREVKASCACGHSFITGSVEEEIKTDICSACHPFYTGKQKLVDSARRAEKFQAKVKAKKENVKSKGVKRAAKDSKKKAK